MKDRLESLDAVRGITIAGMILVNNPGSWSAVYAPLLHAEWHGWTPTDLVFPFFLFIVGVAIPFSFGRYLDDPDRGRSALYRRVFSRSAWIFLIGLALTGLPDLDLAEIRIPGVLQRIALVYLATSLIVLNTTRRAQIVVLAALLLGYHGLMMLVHVPGYGAGNLAPDANLAAWIDRTVLGQQHLWQNRPWDPEGLLSSLPAIGTSLLGVMTGRRLRGARADAAIAARMAGAGGAALAVGLIWDRFLPINKNLWTSSYVMFTAGAALLLLALCYWLIDVRDVRGWARPALVFGRNPLAIYVLSVVIAKVLGGIRVGAPEGVTSLGNWLYTNLFGTWLAPMNASLAFALALVTACWVIAWLLDRRQVYIRI